MGMPHRSWSRRRRMIAACCALVSVALLAVVGVMTVVSRTTNEGISYHGGAEDPWRAWFDSEGITECRAAIDATTQVHGTVPVFLPVLASEPEPTPDACVAVGFPATMRVRGGFTPAHAAWCDVIAGCAAPLDAFDTRIRANPTAPAPTVDMSPDLDFADVVVPLRLLSARSVRALPEDATAWIERLAVPAAATIVDPDIVDVAHQAALNGQLIDVTLAVRFGPEFTVDELYALDDRLAAADRLVPWGPELLARDIRNMLDDASDDDPSAASMIEGFASAVSAPEARVCFPEDPEASGRALLDAWASDGCTTALSAGSLLSPTASVRTMASALVARFGGMRGQQADLRLARALVAARIVRLETGQWTTDLAALTERTGFDAVDPVSGDPLEVTRTEDEGGTTWCVRLPIDDAEIERLSYRGSPAQCLPIDD